MPNIEVDLSSEQCTYYVSTRLDERHDGDAVAALTLMVQKTLTFFFLAILTFFLEMFPKPKSATGSLQLRFNELCYHGAPKHWRIQDFWQGGPQANLGAPSSDLGAP